MRLVGHCRAFIYWTPLESIELFQTQIYFPIRLCEILTAAKIIMSLKQNINTCVGQKHFILPQLREIICPFILQAIKDIFNSLCSAGDNLINGNFAGSVHSQTGFPSLITYIQSYLIQITGSWWLIFNISLIKIHTPNTVLICLILSFNSFPLICLL